MAGSPPEDKFFQVAIFLLVGSPLEDHVLSSGFFYCYQQNISGGVHNVV
jgi:hypothetical protein